MIHRVYTAGYAGRTVAALLTAVQAVRGKLVDIRYSPNSPRPVWRRNALSAACSAAGVPYLWLPDLGNVRYKDGPPIQIKDLGEGIRRLSEMLDKNRTPVLLCACLLPESCHRSVVAERLRTYDYETQELPQ